MSDHWALHCSKQKKEGAKEERRSITPYPRSRNSSGEKGGATQGSDTYRMIKGSWGKRPMVEMNKKTDEEYEDEGTKRDKIDKEEEEKKK